MKTEFLGWDFKSPFLMGLFSHNEKGAIWQTEIQQMHKDKDKKGNTFVTKY